MIGLHKVRFINQSGLQRLKVNGVYILRIDDDRRLISQSPDDDIVP